MNFSFLNLRSLKTRMTLFTLAIFLIGIWMLTFFASRMLREDMQRMLCEQQFSMVSLLADQVNQEIENRLRSLEIVAKEVAHDMQGNPAALQTHLEQRSILQMLFNSGTLITEKDGTTIASVPLSAERIGVNYMDRDFIAAVLNEGKASVGRPVMGRKLRAPVFGIGVPIRDDQGQVIGVLAGVTNLAEPNFTNKITDNRYGKSGGYFLVSMQYRLIVTASDKTRVMEQFPAPGVIPAIDSFLQGNEGSAVYVNPLGVEVLGSIKVIPVAGWFMGAILPTKEAFAPIQAMLHRMLMATIFLTLLAGGLTCWISWRMLIRQLSPMLAATEKLATISDTDPSPQPLPITSQDEIGQLIGGFNCLLENLAKREHTLKESEERFRTLFETAKDGIFLLSSHGVIVSMNPAFARMHGYTADEMLLMDIKELEAPQNVQFVSEQFQLVLEGEQISFEDEHLCKNGQRIPIEVSASLVLFGAEKFILGFLRDISERKQAENKLRHVSRLYALLSQVNHVILQAREPEELFHKICLVAIEFGQFCLAWIGLYDETNGRIKPVAHAGLENAHLTQMPVTTEDLHAGKGPTGSAYKEGEVVTSDDITTDPQMLPWREEALKLGYRSSAAVPFKRNGIPVGTLNLYSTEQSYFTEDERKLLREIGESISFALDAMVSEANRKMAEGKLSESEALHTATQRLSKIGGWRWDIQTQTALWTEETYRIHDLDPNAHRFGSPELITRSLECYEPDDRQVILNAFNKCAEQGDPYDLELPFTSITGRRLYIRTTAHAVKDGDRIIKVIGNIMDITERKRAEAEKAELEAQNRQLMKSESLGRMAGAIAHHFNNHLQVVMGSIEIAMDGFLRGDEALHALKEAMQATLKAANISRLMLTYLGQTTAKQGATDLSEACRQNLILLQAAAPKGMTIETDFPPSGPIICANKGQIQQVLTNLVTNAWEAAGEKNVAIGLTINMVSREDIPASKRFPIDWQPQDAGYACLEVSDAGCGIPNRDIEKIFDPFFTTKFTGRGLGLSAVLGIILAHNGGITVESKPGRGSVFRVFLPLSSEAISLHREEPTPSSEFEGGTVLLVEDEAPVRNMAKIMLTHLGYSVLEAKDGDEALEIFQRKKDAICCVVSDLTMPRMNGWDTLTALRKLSPAIPVILSSGYDEAQVMAGEHPERPNAFLGKPYQLKGLRETILRVLSNPSSELFLS